MIGLLRWDTLSCAAPSQDVISAQFLLISRLRRNETVMIAAQFRKKAKEMENFVEKWLTSYIGQVHRIQ